MTSRAEKSGFSIVELMLVIAIFSILSAATISFFVQSTNQYANLNSDTQSFSNLNLQSQRIAKVLRGLTDITVAQNNQITVYAYFSPADTYVSQIKYYKNAEGTKLLADITRMTANPPIGTLIPSSIKTYTIIDNFKTVASTNLFTYLDSAGAPLTMPINDLHIIKGIQINLSTTNESASKQPTTMSMQVSLRNRKTNL